MSVVCGLDAIEHGSQDLSVILGKIQKIGIGCIFKRLSLQPVIDSIHILRGLFYIGKENVFILLCSKVALSVSTMR